MEVAEPAGSGGVVAGRRSQEETNTPSSNAGRVKDHGRRARLPSGRALVVEGTSARIMDEPSLEYMKPYDFRCPRREGSFSLDVSRSYKVPAPGKAIRLLNPTSPAGAEHRRPNGSRILSDQDRWRNAPLLSPSPAGCIPRCNCPFIRGEESAVGANQGSHGLAAAPPGAARRMPFTGGNGSTAAALGEMHPSESRFVWSREST